jgi:hypothetical protein
MTAPQAAIPVPDTTGATIGLLRELRKGQIRKQASGIAYQIYVGLILAVTWGGTVIVGAARALRHPPQPGPHAGAVLDAAPAALTALGLLLVIAVLRDALWRGPVTVPGPAADWLLDTPVSRARLLRPRFTLSAALTVLAGAAAGIVPGAALVTQGLTATRGGVLRVAGAGALSVALLAALSAGAAALVERYPASWRWLRRATPPAVVAAALLCGLAAWAALGHPPEVLSAIALWSGPWGWAGQGIVAMAGGHAPLWPLATALLGVLALAALAWGRHAAAGVSASALRARARTLGAMSGALMSADTRGLALARSGALRTPGRARFRLRPPRRRELVLPWRDLLALARAPFRLATAVTLGLAAVGLIALAGHGGQLSLLPVAGALSVGYLAAAMLCEGARMDADDPRRSAQLPVRFGSLAWWHAVVPCLVLFLTAGIPAVAISVAAGDPRPVLLLAVTIPVLVAGALVNTYRGTMPANVFVGFDTPLGNTALINIVIWYAWGPVLAVTPMTLLLPSALGSHGTGGLERAVVIGAALAAGLGVYATRRAERLRAS